MYVLLVRLGGAASTLHGSPSRSQPCLWMYMCSRHVYVECQRMVSRDFESGYAYVFEVPNRNPDSRKGTGLENIETYSMLCNEYR